MDVLFIGVLVIFVGPTWGITQTLDTVGTTTLTTSTTPTPSTKVAVPTSATPATMKPGMKINYTLELINNGPVVLDAKITFTARLRDQSGKIAQSKEFQYDWNNNADKEFWSVKGDLEYTYVRQFTSRRVRPGTWVMNVAVYSGDTYEEIINFGSMKFVLTDYLNGFLQIHQSLEYQRNKSIFASDKKLAFLANHTDKFFSDFQAMAPTFQFFWYKDNEFQASTSRPNYEIIFDREGNFTIQTEVYAFFSGQQKIMLNFSEKSPLSSACNSLSLGSFNSTLRRRTRAIADKCGLFNRQLTLKNSLKSVDVSGQRSAEVGQYITVNVTCKGSFPTSLCWNITALNTSRPSLNATCQPDEFTNTCNHTVRIKLTNLGWKTVWFTVYNDVSYMSASFDIYAYGRNSVNVPALTIPIVFGTLGVLVVIVGAVYLNRLRKKPVVEVADFDFHPSVSTEGGPNIFSKLVNKLKYVWKRNTYRQSQSSPDFHETTAKQYGATSLYESL